MHGIEIVIPSQNLRNLFDPITVGIQDDQLQVSSGVVLFAASVSCLSGSPRLVGVNVVLAPPGWLRLVGTTAPLYPSVVACPARRIVVSAPCPAS